MGSAFYVQGLQKDPPREEEGEMVGAWVHEDVGDSAMLRMCSGVRLWLGMGPSLGTGERMTVSRHHDGVPIGVCSRGPRWLCAPRKAHPGRHPSALGSALGGVTGGLHFTV